jgi:hypothetical protein
VVARAHSDQIELESGSTFDFGRIFVSMSLLRSIASEMRIGVHFAGNCSNGDQMRELEQFYAYDILSPLTPERKAFIEKQIDDNAAAFGKDVPRSWHRGQEEEDFLRILVDPVIIEIVFFSQRIELYGAAPAWARLLFTMERKEELRKRIEDVLIVVGFVTPETLEAQRRPKRKLFGRAKKETRDAVV